PAAIAVREAARAMTSMLTREQQRRVVEQLDMVGDPAWQYACELFKELDGNTSPPPKLLGRITDPRHAWVLAVVLESRLPDTERLRKRALKQIATLGNSQLVQGVARCLEHRALQTAAAQTLAQLRHPAGLEPLRKSEAVSP